MINRHKKGFTLIELMIVIVIVAILVGLAVPSFLESVRKSRRSDGLDAIIDIHLEQERYRVNNPAYADDNGDLLIADPLISQEGHYSVAITAGDATSYSITGTAIGSQANDSCGNFTLTFTAGAIAKTTSKGVATQCWRQ